MQGDAQALEEFAKKIGLSREELDKSSAALAGNISAFQAANTQLSQTDLSAIFKKQIQEILDKYAQLGIQAPSALAQIAAAWNISTSASEKAATQTAAAASKILESITGVSKKGLAELKQDAAALEQALGSIKIQDLGTAGFDRARAEIEKVVASFTAAGQQIPASLGNVAASFLVYQNGAGLATDAVGELDRTVAESAARLDGFGRSAEGAAGSAKNLGTGTVEVGRSVDSTRFSIQSLSPTVDELMAKYGAAGRAAQASGQDTKGHADTVAQAAVGVKQGADALSDAGTKAAGAGVQIGTSAEAIDAAASSSRDLSQAAAGVSFAPLAAELSGLQKVVATVGAGVKNDLVASFQSIGAGITGFSAPIVKELELIISKAQEAKAALDAVDS